MLCDVRFIILGFFAVNECMPKAILLCLIFSYQQLFRNWSHSYCVQPASILNPKREISYCTYCSIWSNDQTMSKGVFALVWYGTSRNFFLCPSSRTKRNWILLGGIKQVLFKLVFCLYSADKFMPSSGLPISMPVLSSYRSVRMCL